MQYLYTPDDIRCFWAKVKKGGRHECWPWIGTKTNGYGLFDRNRGGRRFTVRAHRFAYTLTIADIGDGLMLRHKCDNPLCCNPFHLVPGTAKDNSADMVSRGRHWTHQRPQDIPRGDRHWSKIRGTAGMSRGGNHPKAKLTEKDVISIRDQHQQGKKSQRQIAKTFGVSQGLIWQIVTHNYWKHVV